MDIVEGRLVRTQIGLERYLFMALFLDFQQLKTIDIL